MKNELTSIQSDAEKSIQSVTTEEELNTIEQKYFGRKQGKLTLFLKKVPTMSPEDRPILGKLANQIKNILLEKIKAKKQFLEEQEDVDAFFDFSAPTPEIPVGKHHPISTFIREVEHVFGKLGFSSIDGPEIDDEQHNFNALNIPEHHPAREMQDTFWIQNLTKHVLRTQTSNMQIHFMEKNTTPPFRIIAPGKVFRKDSDATHSPMFHQVEGLMIDKDISLGNLKFVLKSALRELISPDTELRFRLSYFPFTEPSLEVDASCPVCTEKDSSCRVCKKTGWLEIGGAGMVHPNVLKNVGLDPEVWNGFAFGFGLERQVMIRSQISDLRQFYENDVRFLEQF